MRRTPLVADWRFQRLAPPVPFWRPQLLPPEWLHFQAPGEIHDALVRAGVLADPYTRRHADGAAWVAESDWVVVCNFRLEPNPFRHRILRFESLATFATVRVDGAEVGRSANAYLPLELDLSALQPGVHELRIEFDSPIRAGMARRAAYVAEHGLPEDLVYFDERAFVRQPACQFGWDWGPRLPNIGPLGPIEWIEYDSRLSSFDVKLTFDQSAGAFRLEAATDRDPSLDIALEHTPAHRFELVEAEPGRATWLVSGELWQPNGLGRQPLFDVVVTTSSGETLRRRTGLRTIEIERVRDGEGETFAFVVNGRRIFAAGANWIPTEAIRSRADSAAIRSQLETFARLGFNMIRVWGGGGYESDAFYDCCDELGILVWQDFPHACMMHPDDPETLAQLESEAAYQVRRLAHRPCLALWCGNNENHQLYEQGWGKDLGTLPDRHLGDELYANVYPQVVSRYHADGHYIPSSPHGRPEDQEGFDVNCEAYGDTHYWEAWHGKGDWAHYRDSRARFSSEFGFASSPSLAVWEQAIPGLSERTFPDPEMLAHDKTGKPFATFQSLVELHYPPAQNLEDWVYTSQLNQRDALRCAIEHKRAHIPCAGTLVWQANDCWPAQSWSLVDHARHLKAAAFEVGRLYAPSCICLRETPDDLEVWIAADGPHHARGVLIAERLHPQDASAPVDRHAFEVQPGAREIVAALPRPHDPASSVYRFSIEGEPGSERTWLGAEPRDMALPAASLHVRMESDRVALEADGVIVDVVAWDADDPSNLFNLESGLQGWRPVTLARGERWAWGFRHRPRRLVARWLTGRCVFALEER